MNGKMPENWAILTFWHNTYTIWPTLVDKPTNSDRFLFTSNPKYNLVLVKFSNLASISNKLRALLILTDFDSVWIQFR